jgi:Leucine-rich repeat (LRR) protein
MKKLVVVILALLVFNNLFSQANFKTYTWNQAKKLSPDSVFSITFEKQKLKSIPDELFNFIYLKKLDLSKNKLESLPTELSKLSNLEFIDLGKNNFTSFPEVICDLKNLKSLSLNRNDISEIPNSIEKLDRLVKVDLWETPLVKLPDAFLTMKNLKYIDARGVAHGAKYQNYWTENLPWIKIEFDAPCNCAN